MMNRITLATFALLTLSISASAAEVCTVSMMGRVCYEEGSPEATAAHMKGNAVAEAKDKKEGKKVATNDKK
jgi:hypothetical protein